MDEIEYLGATSTILSYNLFTYCEGNPVNRKDNNGSSWFSVIGAIIGGAIAGAVISVTSYLVNENVNEEEVTVSGVINSIVTGAVCGAVGAAIETEGSIGQKIGLGFAIGATTASATFVGSITDVYYKDKGLMINCFSNFTATLLVGVPTEVGNVAIQQKIMHNAESVMVSNVKPSNLIKASNFSYALM